MEMPMIVPQPDDHLHVVEPAATSRRSLFILVPEIHEALAKGEAAGVEHYRHAGDLLREAKAQLSHGEWQPWLHQHFDLSARTARRYMSLDKTDTRVHFPSLREATKPRRPRPAPQPRSHLQPISTSNIQMLAPSDEEQSLTRAVAMRLINTGFAVLEMELHPDMLSYTESLARLTQARDLLSSSCWMK